MNLVDQHYNKQQLQSLLEDVIGATDFTTQQLTKLVKKFPKADKHLFKKQEVVQGLRELGVGVASKSKIVTLIEQIKKKPIRTQSGVTPVTVLTKPFPCPGKCIFCPTRRQNAQKLLTK